VASAWIRARTLRSGAKRYEVEFRSRGKYSPIGWGGSFKNRKLAMIRLAWVEGELAAMRYPDIRAIAEEPVRVTFEAAATAWRASRLDLAETTRTQHRIHIDKLVPLIGKRPVDELDPAAFQQVVATLHKEGVARETIRKTLGSAAMALDHAGLDPNPARDRSIKLPRSEAEEIHPPSAVHVETVYHLIPSKHRLPLLWLDWSGARVSSIDLTLIGDYDEPRQRVRLRASTTKTRKALWVDLHPALAQALEERIGPREDRDPDALLFAGSGADALRTSIGKACKAAGIPLFSPHDLRHRRISLMHLRGIPWARIGEFVGQRDLTVTANTYTHVMLEEGELDYARLLAA
jgi:integrase